MLETISNFLLEHFSEIIFTIFLILLGYFLIKVILMTSLKIKRLNSIDDINYLPENVKITFSHYIESFFDYNSKIKTKESSKKYLNSDFLSAMINIRFWFWIPSLFVGLGILGTFYGLQKGITGFDTNSSETIQTSIKSLLDGTSTAFISSLCGISFSLIFHFIEKWKINSLMTKLSKKATSFDNEYLLKHSEIQLIEADRKKIEQDSLISAINEKLDSLLTIKDDQGNTINAIKIVANISKDLKEQRSSIQEIIDDLYNNLSREFSKYSDESKVRIDEVIKTVGAVNTALGSFSNNTGKEIGDTIGIVIKDLSEQLSNISNEFKETIQEGSLKQINEISEMLSSTATILEKTPENLESTISTVQNVLLDELNKNISTFSDVLKVSLHEYTENVEKMMSEITESETERHLKQKNYLDMSVEKAKEREELQSKTLENTLSAFSDINTEQLNQTSEVMKESLEGFKIQFSDILSSYKTESSIVMDKNMGLIKEIDRVVATTKENTDIIHKDISKISELNKDSVNRFADLIANNEKILSQFDSQISGLISITTNFKNISADYSVTTQENSKVLDLIKTTTESSEQTFKDYIESGNKTIELFKNVTSAERDNINTQVENYRLIHKEIENVFKQLNKGLTQYQVVTKEQLNNALDSYINNFQNAVYGLQSTVSELGEALEALDLNTNRIKSNSGKRNE